MNCVICNKEIKEDCQYINGNYYHNNCIENIVKENKQLKGELETAKNNQKQASDSCRQHRLASKNHIRRLERREKQILRLKEQLEKTEKGIKEANKIILDCLLSQEYINLDSDYLSTVFFNLTKKLNLDIDKGEMKDE